MVIASEQRSNIKPFKLVCLIKVFFICGFISVQSRAQSKVPDPLLWQLGQDCKHHSWLGIKSLMILKKYYPNYSLKNCLSSPRFYKQTATIGTVNSVHTWLLFKSAVESRDMSFARSLSKHLKPLSAPKVSPINNEPNSLSNFEDKEDIGLYCSAMFKDQKQNTLVWTIAPSKYKRVLGISYRGKIQIDLGDKKQSLGPSKHMWIDDYLVPISTTPEPIEIKITPAQGSCFMARVSRSSQNNLWKKIYQQLDKEPGSVSDDALLVLALIAQEAEIDEISRLLPIIEADQRWSKQPTLWLSQAFQALSPPEIRAQAWGDYSPELALNNELSRASKSEHSTKVTLFKLLSLNEFNDHLTNGRINKARLLLDHLIAQNRDYPTPWLNHRVLFAQNALDHYLGLNLRPLFRLNHLNSEAGLLFEHVDAVQAYLQALNKVTLKEKVTFLQSKLFTSWLRQKFNLGLITPSLLQITTEFLVYSKSTDTLWLEGLKRVCQGPIGLEFARQLEKLFNVESLEHKHTLLKKYLGDRSISQLNSLIPTEQNSTIHTEKTVELSPFLLGGTKPWLQAKQEQIRSNSLRKNSIRVETVYQHLHYSLYQGRLRKTERRVLKPLNAYSARSLKNISLPHSPSRQSFTIDHLEHIRVIKGSYHNLQKIRRSQRSLSNPNERLYYDLVAEELHFDNLRPGDMIDVQWSITEYGPDPDFSLPHADLVILQDYSYKRCLLVTIDSDLKGKLKSDLELKTYKELQSKQAFDKDCGHIKKTGSSVVSISHLIPATKEELGLQGTSIFPYIHLSNLESWSTIAEIYKAMLNPIIKPSDSIIKQAKIWTKGLKVRNKSKSDSQRFEREVLEKIFLKITQNTRYLGLEFGKHSYEPALPDVTLERGLGDCKDRAALMIALARSLGIRLDFAMVRTRSAGRIKENGLASLSSFDHAIVYSPTLNKYFDPTLAYYDPKVLPQADHGAQALVINTDSSLNQFETSKSNISLKYIPEPFFEDIGEVLRIKPNLVAINSVQAELKLELYGEKAMAIRKWQAEHEKSKLPLMLNQLFPHLKLSTDRFKITKQQIEERDPIIFHINLTHESHRRAKKRLPIQFTFNLTHDLAFNTSERRQAIYIPQTRRSMCMEQPKKGGNLQNEVIDRLKKLSPSPVKGWTITYSNSPDEICFHVKLKANEVLASEYKKVYHWLHETEAELNQGLKLLIDHYM